MNLSSEPAPREFHRVLQALIDRGDAERVLVRIHDIQDPPDRFFSATVHVIGTIGRDVLAHAVAELHPDELYAGWMDDVPENEGPIAEGTHVFTLCWD